MWISASCKVTEVIAMFTIGENLWITMVLDCYCYIFVKTSYIEMLKTWKCPIVSDHVYRKMTYFGNLSCLPCIAKPQ